MFDSTTDAAQNFHASRAAEYETQSRIALAGHDARHELAACLLAAVGRLDNPVKAFDHSFVLYGWRYYIFYAVR